MSKASVHYYRAKMGKHACGARGTRSATLASTSDRHVFGAHRAAGTACERCCAAVDKMDAIAAKHDARK